MNKFLEQYQAYKVEGHRESGTELANHIYRHLTAWIEAGKPDQNFIDELRELVSMIQENPLSEKDLIDLGLYHAAEALQSWDQKDDAELITEFYVTEARLPFFAYLDENSYRIIKNIEFNEIDFLIFEVIQGNFPHDSAQIFLSENDWADVWVALRYLDAVEDKEARWRVLEKMILIRSGLLEKSIILCYILLRDPDQLISVSGGEDSMPAGIAHDLPSGPVQAIVKAASVFLETGILDTSWEERVEIEFEKEVLFSLLALFEISQCEPTAAWVRVLERTAADTWLYSMNTEKFAAYQPLPEFAASILFLFPDEELEEIMKTSLLIPVFLESMEKYTYEAFHDMLHAVMRAEETFRMELELQLERFLALPPEGALFERFRDCFAHIGCEIIFDDGIARLVSQGEGPLH